jgi:tetratricopeptide (TPR) repeat protein
MASLRDLVFDAVATGDLGQVETLCREHHDAIVDEFPSWQSVPPEIRGEPRAMQRYANGLITTARVFAERLGSPVLLAKLQGNPEDNPLVRWETELDRARNEMHALQYAEATRRLEALAAQTASLEGTGPERLRPLTLGFLADGYFQQRHGERAVPLLQEALARSRALHDLDGVIAYLGNLYEVHRYLGRPAEAARFAGELAQTFAEANRPVDAARYRRVAAITRGGAPKNRVVAVLDDDSRLELDELPKPPSGRVRFVFERDRLTLRPAGVLVQHGREAGAAGKSEEALALFRRAAAADPFDPDPRYQEAFTLVLLRRYEEAVAGYDATEGLAPGWFHCRADRWLANELAARRLAHGTFQALYTLQDGPHPPDQKLELANDALAATPQVAALHFHRGRALAALGRTGEVAAAFRDGLAAQAEPDIRTRLLVALALAIEPGSERGALLDEAIRLGGNLIAAASARLVA